MTVALSDRRTGVANFRTHTEVASRVTLDIAPSAVPETVSTFWLLLCGGLILCAFGGLVCPNGGRQARNDKHAIARLPLARFESFAASRSQPQLSNESQTQRESGWRR